METQDGKFAKWFWQWIHKICNKKMVCYWQIKFLRNLLESNLCDYSDAYVLNITVVGANE